MLSTPVRSMPRQLCLLPVVCAIVAATGAVSARAQSLYPYFIQASETLTYDSNLFRVPDRAGETSDVISTTALTVGFDQPIGRQHVYASAGVSKNFYRDNGDLDSFGYNLTAGLDWEALSRWSGSVRVKASQGQASFDQYGALATTVRGRNLERSETLDLRAQYGGASILVAEVLGNYTRVDYSSSSFDSRSRDSHMVGAGLRYRPGGFWSFGTALRFTRGNYPSYTDTTTGLLVGDGYNRRDWDLNANYQASGFSSLSARGTLTRETHDAAGSRDFNGVTGAVSWNYQLSGKVHTNLTYSRDTGTGDSFITGPATSPTDPNTTPSAPTPNLPTATPTYLTDSQLSNRIAAQATWNATAKVSVLTGLSYSRDRYDNAFLLNDAQTTGGGHGNTKQFNLSVDYAITRVWSAGCGFAYLSRSSGVVVNNLSYDYNAKTVFCSGQLSLR